MISTSFMTGTGFMKCMPMTLSGRLVWAAMRPMGMDEVLRGQDRSRFADLVQVPENLELDVLLLGGRLDHEVRRGHVLEVDAALDSAQQGVLFRRRHLAFFDIAGQDVGDGFQALVDEFLLDVVHDDCQPAGGRHLGDAVAHLPRADDTECFNLHQKSSCD